MRWPDLPEALELTPVGHYPVWSVCEHGPTKQLVQSLKPLLEKDGVHAYLAGHDHCQEYLDEGKGLQHHGMGSAHTNDASTAHAGGAMPS